MGCKNRNCLQCVWNLASTTGVTQKLSCTNSDYKIRKNFNDAASAETCKGYLEDDPNFQVKVVRDTRETLMKNIHQMAVNNGYYGQIESMGQREVAEGAFWRILACGGGCRSFFEL